VAEEPDCREVQDKHCSNSVISLSVSRCEQPIWRCHCLSQLQTSPNVSVLGDVPSSLYRKECGQPWQPGDRVNKVILRMQIEASTPLGDTECCASLKGTVACGRSYLTHFRPAEFSLCLVQRRNFRIASKHQPLALMCLSRLFISVLLIRISIRKPVSLKQLNKRCHNHFHSHSSIAERSLSLYFSYWFWISARGPTLPTGLYSFPESLQVVWSNNLQ
jgi:hypothetical protein